MASEAIKRIDLDRVQRKIDAGEPVSAEEMQALQQVNQNKLNEVQQARNPVNRISDSFGTNDEINYTNPDSGKSKIFTLQEKLKSIMGIFKPANPANNFDMAPKYASAAETAAVVAGEALDVASTNPEVSTQAFNLVKMAKMAEAELRAAVQSQINSHAADITMTKKQQKHALPAE